MSEIECNSRLHICRRCFLFGGYSKSKAEGKKKRDLRSESFLRQQFSESYRLVGYEERRRLLGMDFWRSQDWSNEQVKSTHKLAEEGEMRGQGRHPRPAIRLIR